MKKRIIGYFCGLLLVLLVFVMPVFAQTITFTVDRNWVPRHDNFHTIQVHLPVGSVSAGDYVVFQLRSSDWPGYCMNGYFGSSLDADEKNSGADMSFIRGNQHTSGAVTWPVAQSGEAERVQTLYALLGANPPSSFGLRIECYDYGAVAKLHAVVYNAPTTANTVMLPVDADGNYIADIWQERPLSGGNGWAGTDGVGTVSPWRGGAADDLEQGPLPCGTSLLVVQLLCSNDACEPYAACPVCA